MGHRLFFKCVGAIMKVTRYIKKLIKTYRYIDNKAWMDKRQVDVQHLMKL